MEKKQSCDRHLLTENTTIYVDWEHGDDAKDGSTPEKAKKTLDFLKCLDLAGFSLTANIAHNVERLK